MPAEPATHSKRNQEQSPLFSSLPPEIRQLIYNYALPSPSRVEIHRKCWGAKRSPTRYTFGSTNNRHWHELTWHTGRWGSPPDQDWWNSSKEIPHVLLICWRMYYEAASLLYSAKAICLDSPVLLAHLHHTLPSSVFNEIRSLELVFCSNHAAPIAELNAQTIATFKTILKGMPNVSRLLILLPYQCWRDFFYESPSAPPARRLEASQQWEREHAFYGRDFNAYGWPDVEPYLDWLKEFQCDIDVTVSMFERRPGISGVATASDVLRAEKMLRVRRRLEAGSFLLVE